MTPETQQLISDLKELQELTKRKKDLIRERELKSKEKRPLKTKAILTKHKKNAPIAPLKKPLRSLTPPANSSILDTLKHIRNIPQIKKLNEENMSYNTTEYPRLLKIYEKEMQKHKEEEIALEAELKKEEKSNKEAVEKEINRVEKEINRIERREKNIRQGFSRDVDVDDISSLLIYLETFEFAATLEEAYHELHMYEEERKEEELIKYCESLSNDNYAEESNYNYAKEIDHHNGEMERMEQERLRMEQERLETEQKRLRMEQDRARAEEREKERAREQERIDRMREEYKTRQEAREERKRNEAGLSHQCNTCKLAIKCYKKGSYPCPSYSPR